MEDRLCVSRFRRLKADANRDAKWMREHRGASVKVTGKRGIWRVRAKMPLSEFAMFCCIEAKRESSK